MFSKKTRIISAGVGAFLLLQLAGTAFALTPVAMPSGKWAVGPIATMGNDPASGYCSMKTSYKNGQMVVFARDQQGVNSLAIDFKKNKLDVGRQYGVVLAIPPYVMRQVTAVAATPRVLIMQMGHDPSFYDAVSLHEQMVIMLPSTGERFAYGLAGTSAALGALDDCVKEMNPYYQGDRNVQMISGIPSISDIEPAAGNAELQITVEEHQPDSQLVSNIDVLKAENKALALEKEMALAKLELERVKGQDLLQKNGAEITALKASLAKDRGVNEKVNARIGALESENNKLRAQTQLKQAAANDCVLPAAKPVVASLVTSSDPLRDLILSARVAPASDIVSEPGYTSSGLAGYVWQADDIYGGAQRIKWEESKDFSQMVSGYLAIAKERCPDDFAVKNGQLELVDGKQFQTAEIACIGGTAQSAAALVFIGDGDVLTIVSHEGAPGQIDTSLSKRDAVIEKLRASSGGQG